MKTNTKTQTTKQPYNGPTVFDEPNKALKPVPKIELTPTNVDLTNQIKDLEVKLLELKALQVKLYGKQSNYKQPVNLGVGAFIRECIISDMKNVDILKLVEEKYINNNTTYACVAWYRNDMKKKGLI